MIGNLIEAGVTAAEWRELGLAGVSEDDYLASLRSAGIAIDTTRLYLLFAMRGDEAKTAEYRAGLTRDQLLDLDLNDLPGQ